MQIATGQPSRENQTGKSPANPGRFTNSNSDGLLAHESHGRFEGLTVLRSETSIDAGSHTSYRTSRPLLGCNFGRKIYAADGTNQGGRHPGVIRQGNSEGTLARLMSKCVPEALGGPDSRLRGQRPSLGKNWQADLEVAG